jgi:hypothetical protein
LRFGPRSVVARLEVDTRIGPPKGLFFAVRVGGKRYYVVTRCVQELQDADRDVIES